MILTSLASQTPLTQKAGSGSILTRTITLTVISAVFSDADVNMPLADQSRLSKATPSQSLVSGHPSCLKYIRAGGWLLDYH